MDLCNGLPAYLALGAALTATNSICIFALSYVGVLDLDLGH